MAKPDTFTWATDATINDPGKPWDGSDTIVAPTAAQLAAGFKPKQRPPAQYVNYLFNLLAQWVAYLETHTPFFTLHQNWTAPMYAAWTEVTDGTATVVRQVNQDPDLVPGVWAKLRVAGFGTPDVAALYSETIAKGPQPDRMISRIDFRVVSTSIAGATQVAFMAGLFFDPEDVASVDDFIKIEKTSASDNWIFRTGSPGGVSTDTDTGVIATGAQKIHIAVYGADDPDGARAECWIDDELVATNTTNLPDADLLKLGINLTDIADGGGLDVWVSPITYVAELF